MKIGYISDEHLDFWCKEVNPQRPKFKRQITRFIKEKLKPEKGDILFMAGDQGHYNQQIVEYIKQMKEWYTHIVIVSGNHNMYLVSNKQKSDYFLNSFNKLKELQAMLIEIPGVHYLDRENIEIDGIKISGFSNWYNLDTGFKIDQWKRVMNDANNIMVGSEPHNIHFGYGGRELIVSFDSQRYYQDQLDYLKSVDDCDIIVCHVCPIIIPDEHLREEYVEDTDNIFYMVDQQKIVEEIKPDLVLFGHQHDVREFELNNINYKINAAGYPGEKIGFEGIMHSEFIK